MSKTRVAWVCVLLAAGVLCAGSPAHAQMGRSLTVESSEPLLDVIGRRLPGTWGFPDNAALVEIRKTNPSGGVAAPNQMTGEGDGDQNPMVRSSYMGTGVLGDNPSMFSEVFEERLGNGSFFVRLYDGATPGGSYYYRDSAIFSDDGTALTFYPAFPYGWRLISTSAPDVDSDGDGIPDTLENEVLGTDPNKADTDGDGWDDLFEVLHGPPLSPTEPTPIHVYIHGPAVAQEPPVVSDPYALSWWTIPGLWYRLEYRESAVDESQYVEVDVFQASDDELIVDVDDWIRQPGIGTGFFRVLGLPYFDPD